MAAAAALMAMTACSPSAGSPSSAGATGGAVIGAQVASYQLVANRPGRLLVALVSADNEWVSFGTVRLTFSYLGAASPSSGTTPTAAAPASTGVGVGPATARFLPIPGTPDATGGQPRLTAPADGRGLYAVESITFPAAGYWNLEVSGTLTGGDHVTADAAFEVLSQPIVLDVGDKAPRTDNPVIGDRDVPEAAIDSRAAIGDGIPDPELHRTSIADAIAAHRPALVAFATPVYCVSQFCGPVTDMIADLAQAYADRADFIHVEIYRDFDANQVNQAAIDWLLTPSGDLREPWVFLIGADGKIAASWDTMVSRSEIEPLLQALPKS